tara:strand:- start:385 stop:1095 length:711 start_codon:yes stop_codon:yes gene_type:complete
MYFGLVVASIWALLTLVWYFVPNAAANLYDLLIVHMTRQWYAAVLERLDDGSRILDIGIGTATALVHNKELVLRKKVRFVGIDYERRYVTKAQQVVAEAGLQSLVTVHCLTVYHPQLRSALAGKAAFDAAYFSGSLTLMPDPAAALKVAALMVKPGGFVYVTQTFQNRPAPIMARLKPLLRRFTSVDFGKLTYLAEVQKIAEAAGMEIVEDAPVPGSIDNSSQTARLVVLKSKSSR